MTNPWGADDLYEWENGRKEPLTEADKRRLLIPALVYLLVLIAAAYAVFAAD